MDHALRSCGRCFERGLVVDVAPDDLDAQITEPRGPVRVPGDRTHGQVVLAHAPDEVGADKAGAAGHEDHGTSEEDERRTFAALTKTMDEKSCRPSSIVLLFLK